MYVCIYVFMYVCMYVFIYVCIYVCMYIYIYVCIYLFIHLFIYIFIYYKLIINSLLNNYIIKKYLNILIKYLFYFNYLLIIKFNINI